MCRGRTLNCVVLIMSKNTPGTRAAACRRTTNHSNFSLWCDYSNLEDFHLRNIKQLLSIQRIDRGSIFTDMQEKTSDRVSKD